MNDRRAEIQTLLYKMYSHMVQSSKQIQTPDSNPASSSSGEQSADLCASELPDVVDVDEVERHSTQYQGAKGLIHAVVVKRPECRSNAEIARSQEKHRGGCRLGGDYESNSVFGRFFRVGSRRTL